MPTPGRGLVAAGVAGEQQGGSPAACASHTFAKSLIGFSGAPLPSGGYPPRPAQRQTAEANREAPGRVPSTAPSSGFPATEAGNSPQAVWR